MLYRAGRSSLEPNLTLSTIQLNAWAADYFTTADINNLAPLDMLFLSIIAKYNKPNKSKNHTDTFVYYLLLVKMECYFYLEKNWSSQNQSSWNVSTGTALYVV